MPKYSPVQRLSNNPKIIFFGLELTGLQLVYGQLKSK